MKEITEKIEELLQKEYHCSREELGGSGTLYTVNTDAKQPYLKMLAYRNRVVVCASESLLPRVRELLRDKTRDEIFECPFVYGQTIHFVPDSLPDRGPLPEYRYEFLLGKEINALQGLTGFENSLTFDSKGNTSTRAIFLAKDSSGITGIAGAAGSPVNGLWEVGVDVTAEHRRAGLGTYLVSALTRELLARGIAPFYSASVTNIASQMVASRCGYIPRWVDTFGTTLDGSSGYNSIVRALSLGQE